MAKAPKKLARPASDHSWQYKGISISFDPMRAIFYADAPGKALSAPSLDAIKAKIDKLGVDTFVPFTALVPFAGYGKPPADLIVGTFKTYRHGRNSGQSTFLLRVQIVALDKSEGRVVFRPAATSERITHRNDDGLSRVYPDKPEVIAAWLADCQARFDKERAEHEADEVVTLTRQALDALEMLAHDWRPS